MFSPGGADTDDLRRHSRLRLINYKPIVRLKSGSINFSLHWGKMVTDGKPVMDETWLEYP